MEACRKWAYILQRNKKLEATSHTFLLICCYQMWGTVYLCYLLLILANSIHIYIYIYILNVSNIDTLWTKRKALLYLKIQHNGLIIWKKKKKKILDILDQPKISLRERGAKAIRYAQKKIMRMLLTIFERGKKEQENGISLMGFRSLEI